MLADSFREEGFWPLDLLLIILFLGCRVLRWLGGGGILVPLLLHKWGWVRDVAVFGLQGTNSRALLECIIALHKQGSSAAYRALDTPGNNELVMALGGPPYYA